MASVKKAVISRVETGASAGQGSDTTRKMTAAGYKRPASDKSETTVFVAGTIQSSGVCPMSRPATGGRSSVSETAVCRC
ncbi:MAG: hypothetical protein J07HX5_00852 [halophilic archaeon J07HX5]|nr:MAG: hypothetical protein J07HX5_00852 [halophilic archaeon J07HX5]